MGRTIMIRQISRNLTVRNPGFEAEMWSSILNCQAATATTCTDSDSSTCGRRISFREPRFKSLRCSQRADWHHYRKYRRQLVGTGITLTFSAPLSPAPASGDVIQVRMQVPGNPQAGWWVSESGGATFSPDTTDLSPETPASKPSRLTRHKRAVSPSDFQF